MGEMRRAGWSVLNCRGNKRTRSQEVVLLPIDDRNGKELICASLAVEPLIFVP